MGISSKQQEDIKRLRYIRVLERFIRSVVGYLVKEEETNFEGFCLRVAKQKNFLDKVTAVVLYKSEYVQVQQFVQQLLDATKTEPEDFEAFKNRLLYGSNQLHKDKNSTKYKKDKHTNKKYNDGY